MLAFAVSIKGLHQPGEAAWVLAIDPIGDRILTAVSDGSLKWFPLEDCVFAKIVNPEGPMPVIPAQPTNAIVRANGVHLR